MKYLKYVINHFAMLQKHKLNNTALNYYYLLELKHNFKHYVMHILEKI
jgi:hypothetical protein